MRSKLEDMRQRRNRAGERRRCPPPRMAMVAERLAELSHAMRTTDVGRLRGYQLLMLDGPSTRLQSRGSGRLKCCAAAYIVKLTLVLQKRYFVDHLRLTYGLACRSATRDRPDARSDDSSPRHGITINQLQPISKKLVTTSSLLLKNSTG